MIYSLQPRLAVVRLKNPLKLVLISFNQSNLNQRNQFSSKQTNNRTNQFKDIIKDGPSLGDFIESSNSKEQINLKLKREDDEPRLNLPPWLKTKIPTGPDFFRLKDSLKDLKLSTVCQEARCPNIGECWSTSKDHISTATIMLMGDTCTRGCRFCSVKTSRKPPALDPNEPLNTANQIFKWGIDYIVLTSVDRDDLDDGGSSHFASTVQEIKKLNDNILVECLTPDFAGNLDHVSILALSGLDVYAHNIETVEKYQRYVRDHRANYRQSLSVLESIKKLNEKYNRNIYTKTSIMLGFGESDDEIKQTMEDLRRIDVDFLTLGQYIQPTKRHIKVNEYVTPDKFNFWKDYGDRMGFIYTASGPLVRSSYRAGEFFIKNVIRKNRESKSSH